MWRVAAVCVAASCALMFVSCDARDGGDSAGDEDTRTADIVIRADDPVLVGAGDIAGCWWRGDFHTGRMLDTIPGTVFTLGDNVYQDGTAVQFRDCYEPAWGRARARTYPSMGNHDERTDNGGPYFDYFGANAGPRGRGWYSYRLGAWHVIVYNSAASIDVTSPQMAWIRQELARNAGTTCILAYGHHPRFSSGKRRAIGRMKPLWDALYAGGADVVVSGHEHFYERFAPQKPDGEADDVRGIRQFIAGTGGAPFYRIRKRRENSEAARARHGLLKLTLHANGYSWTFAEVGRRQPVDEGSASCSPPRISSN